MFRKLLALAFLLVSAPALAQNVTCATRPIGDNTNACASTAFVNGTLSAIPLPNGHIFVGNTSNIATDFGTLATFSSGGTFNLNPTPSSLNQGFVVTQTLAGTAAGSFSWANLINVSSDTVNNGDGNERTALYIVQKTGGSTVLGQRSALHVEQWLTAATNSGETQKDIVGGTFQVYASAGNNGGNFIALNAVSILGANTPATGATGLTGLEIDLSVNAGSSTVEKFGITIVQISTDAVQGSSLDAGIDFVNNGTSGGWKTGILFSSTSVSSGGTVIDTSALPTTANGGPSYLFKGGGTFYVDGNANVQANAIILAGGQLFFNGSSSGVGKFVVQGAMGSAVWTLPTNTGTMVVTASTPLAISATTGNITCATCLTANQTITLSGDVTGSGTTAITTTLATAQPAVHTWALTQTFTTGIISPLYIGGSGTTGTQLTFQTTSGNGTTDAFVWNRGNNGATLAMTLNNVGLGVGTVTPTLAVFTVSGNSTLTPATGPNGPSYVGQFIGVDGANPTLLVDAFGTAKLGYLIFRSARGTLSSFTATQSGDLLGFIGGVGANANNTFATPAGAQGGAFFGIVASETWTVSAGGAELRFYTTPNTTQAVAIAGRFQNSGGLTLGSVTTDPGIGGLYINAQMFMPNITTSSSAQTGTVCWTTGTGKFTVDTTVGCLTSVGVAKNIISRPAPMDALGIITALEPVSFRYKDGYGDSGHYEQFGLIAEQVASVDERLAGRDPNGALQGVRYQELTAVLAGAIKQLKADNDNLRAANDNFEARLSRLEAASK